MNEDNKIADWNANTPEQLQLVLEMEGNAVIPEVICQLLRIVESLEERIAHLENPNR